jgi:hypothetical protein
MGAQLPAFLRACAPPARLLRASCAPPARLRGTQVQCLVWSRRYGMLLVLSHSRAHFGVVCLVWSPLPQTQRDSGLLPKGSDLLSKAVHAAVYEPSRHG